MSLGGADDPGAPTVLHGLGVGRGVVVAPLAVLRPAHQAPADEPPADDAEAAAQQVVEAFAQVAAALSDQAARATGALAEVLTATAAIAGDAAVAAEAARRVRAGTGPATAVTEAVEGFVAMFTAAGGYLAERVTDLRSVRDRVVARLLGVPEPGLGALSVPSVVAGVDLAPADTAALDLAFVVGLVTEEGGPTGHTAIIAGQLGLPCLVRTPGITAVPDGTVVALDAAAGQVLVDPPADVRARLQQRADAERELARDTAPGATADGHRIDLLANIGTAADADRAAATPVAGSGLFRTEVLFLGRQTAPTLAEQTEVYGSVLRAFGDRKVVVRTLDAGADKPLAFATQADEENPALGVRGYRLVRTLPDLLGTQLAALGAVAAGLDEADRDHLWVMAPMVATPAEARDFATRARAAGITRVGVMVEVPAAALRAREILAEVDFVSLGTNDLAQYTMATDRLRGELADLLDPWQPAVLDLVAATARAGVDLGKPVGVCGESAADPLMALVLTGLGITSLSMSPAAVPAARYAVRRHTLAQCRAIADAALAAGSAPEARAAALALTASEVRTTLTLG
ncbi:putative PEP-binding protein [Cellulomonas soli]|uniref:Phosphoenolpyruvate-protein phosphotransferase n=1 Tax=Cellulomonas soli TaxID=931535 RepID=A0A512PHX9_9CELL|nr:putative PEP-binding protein [Cellulomonas soli]NYI58801.1 phosphotransferase system enzyme I (PtsI) [Cellulomonas soli]GEP70819.1 phosphoenolpyruvate-protein phosphotransferase [Cellulomonas soli]